MVPVLSSQRSAAAVVDSVKPDAASTLAHLMLRVVTVPPFLTAATCLPAASRVACALPLYNHPDSLALSLFYYLLPCKPTHHDVF